MAKAKKGVARARKSRNGADEQDLRSFLDGYYAGVCDKPNDPPKDKDTDKASWSLGWLEGYVHWRAHGIVHHAKTRPGANINLGGDYQGVGCRAWTNGFRVGMRTAARRRWKLGLAAIYD